MSERDKKRISEYSPVIEFSTLRAIKEAFGSIRYAIPESTLFDASGY
jgi:hypothetical protein